MANTTQQSNKHPQSNGFTQLGITLKHLEYSSSKIQNLIKIPNGNEQSVCHVVQSSTSTTTKRVFYMSWSGSYQERIYTLHVPKATK